MTGLSLVVKPPSHAPRRMNIAIDGIAYTTLVITRITGYVARQRCAT